STPRRAVPFVGPERILDRWVSVSSRLNVQRTLQFFNVAQRFPYAGIEQLRVVKVQIARSFPGHLTFACTLGQASQRTCGCSLFRTKRGAWPFVPTGEFSWRPEG